MKIPTEDHYAILTEDYYIVPGDERSRTNPGHGYSEYIVSTIKYDAFMSLEAIKSKLDSMSMDARSKVRIIQVKPLKIKTNIEFDIY